MEEDGMIMNNKKLFGIVAMIAFLLMVIPVSATVNITTQQIGMTNIVWTWPLGTQITNESVDGIMVYTFDPNLNSFDLSSLPPNESHIFCIYTPDDSGCNTASTLPDTTIYQQITALLVKWWYLALITVFIILGMQRKMGVFLIVASIISLYALTMDLMISPVQTTDIAHLPFFLYLFFFIFPYVLIYFKGGWLK
jgi:hypothetical protein